MSSRALRNRATIPGRPVYPKDPLVAMSLFKRGKDPANVSLRRLVRQLVKAKIAHAVMGGLAVYAHGYHRFTDDVDVLVTAEGLAEFRRCFVPKNYLPVPGRSRRFIDKLNRVTIDLLVAGQFPGTGQPGPIAFPDPETVREERDSIFYIHLVPLVQLKLAASRYQDFADVVNLIRENHLDESFLECLHPSVRPDFIECLEEKRREDDYIARNG